MELHLENGLKIYFGLSAKNSISLGDFIQKDQGTYLYKVYRKDLSDKYGFYAIYDFAKME